MDALVIQGPCTLSGSIRVRGAKNAIMPILAAAAAADAPVELSNVPLQLGDVQVLMDLLRHIGCRVTGDGDRLRVETTDIATTVIPEEYGRKIRYSLLMLGLLLPRCGTVKLCAPGGCAIGERKYDLHLQGLRALGADIRVTDQGIEARADRLTGAEIEFYLPTTSGTENVMLAACFAEGHTVIRNANTRPEVADMARMLNTLGADITVSNRMVEIEGVSRLGGGSHRIMSDRHVALTYMIGAALSGSEIRIEDFTLDHIRADVEYLRQAGVDVFSWGGSVFVSGRDRRLSNFDLFTAPYPGVNSDMQPIFAALATQCQGESTITDQRFMDRFQYVGELRKMGADIEHYGNCAVVRGPTRLHGTEVAALDLRCGASLAMAALAAEGPTTITNADQIDRGYEDLDANLRNLGANVERCDSPIAEDGPTEPRP